MSEQGETTANGCQYNWHPQVHTHVNEALWFHLIRFKDPTSAPVPRQLDDLLREYDVRHACKYTLYGYWDALIRVWMTDPMKRRFLREMKHRSAELGIDEVRPFAVSGLHYMWHDPSADLLDSGPSLETLNAFEGVVNTTKGIAADVPPESLEVLKENGILLVRPPFPGGAIKLYLALDYTARSSLSEEQEVDLIRRAVERAGLAERCSLYVGAGPGFARYLLRCAVDDFKSVLGMTQRFYEELQELHTSGLAMRPMTLVIIDSTEESDDLNCFDSLSSVDEQTVNRLQLGIEGRRRLAAMSHLERAHVHDLVVRVDALSVDDKRLSPKLRGLLRACIEENIDGVISAMAFVGDFEWLFRQYMIRLWGTRLGGNGGDWRKMLRDLLEATDSESNVEVIEQKTPGKWSFGEVHRFAQDSGRADPQIQASLVGEVGEDWHGRLHALVDLRNFHAHNRVREEKRLSDLEGHWGERVEEIINSAELYFRLDKLVNNRKAADDGD